MCDTGDGPLSINVYMINLMAVGGVVTYSGFINRQPTMTTTTGELNPDGIRYKNFWGGSTQLPPGQYRLCTLTITGMTGTPRIDIVDLVSGSVDYTGFGTSCSGLEFDNNYRLDGPNTQALGAPGDFTDWDGLGAAVSNQPPVLVAIGNKTVDELSTLTFTATAFDPNPAAILTFTLDAGAPAGASINPTSGDFSWTPTEAQGPGTFPITMRVTNNASPPLSDSKTFTVTVREVNAAPVLSPIGNKIACGPGTTLTFTVTATDADIPANNLTFSLDPGAPAGATIVSSTGVFSWTPSAFGTFPVTIRVTDNGTPPLSDFEAILITVTAGANQPPILGSDREQDRETSLRPWPSPRSRRMPSAPVRATFSPSRWMPARRPAPRSMDPQAPLAGHRQRRRVPETIRSPFGLRIAASRSSTTSKRSW